MDELTKLTRSLLEDWWNNTDAEAEEIKWDDDDDFWVQMGTEREKEYGIGWTEIGGYYSDKTIVNQDLAQIMLAVFRAIKKRKLHFDLQSCDRCGEYKRYVRVYSGLNRIIGSIHPVRGGEYSHQEEAIALLGAYVDWLKKNQGETV